MALWPLRGYNKTRVSGTTDEVTVKSSRAKLHRLVVSNSTGSGKTITLRDGDDVVHSFLVADAGTQTVEFGCVFTQSLSVQLSDTDIELLVIWV